MNKRKPHGLVLYADGTWAPWWHKLASQIAESLQIQPVQPCHAGQCRRATRVPGPHPPVGRFSDRFLSAARAQFDAILDRSCRPRGPRAESRRADAAKIEPHELTPKVISVQ